MPAAPRPFNLLRWFSFASLITIVLVALGLDLALRHFLRTESIVRDATLSAQFITSIMDTEQHHAALPANVELVHLLDARTLTPGARELPEDLRSQVVGEFLDHLRFLPDTLLVNLFAPDGVVIWSTNGELIDRRIDNNEDLAEAFRSRMMVAHGHVGTDHDRDEQRFLGEPEDFYIENYVPLADRSGKVRVVAEIYKEPKSVIAAIKRGDRLISIAVAIGAAIIFLALFGIVRRAARELDMRQQQLVESESLVLLGEMSEAVAHGLRSPLAAIRTSAELALDNELPAARKNARDIVSQTDRLTALVGNLLLFAGPMSDRREAVDLLKVVDDTLLGYGSQILRSAIRVNWVLPAEPRPMVEGHAGLLGQALSSIVSNAIEAMPEGGTLRVNFEISSDKHALELIVGDSGAGMAPEQLAMAMKPFYTSKRNGFGVGLPIARRILERFGGSLRLESTPGFGTQAHLYFYLSE